MRHISLTEGQERLRRGRTIKQSVSQRISGLRGARAGMPSDDAERAPIKPLVGHARRAFTVTFTWDRHKNGKTAWAVHAIYMNFLRWLSEI